MKSISLGTLLWLLTVAGRAQAAADLQVVFGTGSPHPWSSSVTVSNPNSIATHVILSETPDQTCLPVTACTFADLAPFATATLKPPQFEGVGLTYVGSTGTVQRPAIAARAFDDTGRSVDLPVFRLAELLANQPATAFTLTLPGAIGGPSGRSNLLLANLPSIGQSEGGQVILEVNIMGADGFVQATTRVILNYGETLFVQDVVAWEGLPSLDQGQISVTNVGGAGSFWAVMPVARADGSLSVVKGSGPF